MYWDDPEDLEGFKLLLENTIPTFEYQVTGLTSAQEYKFRLVATNIIGDSSYSVTASFIASALSDPPSAPLITERTDAPSIKIEWTAPPYNGGSSIKQYFIYVDNVHTGTVSGNTFEYTEIAPVLVIGAL